MRPALHLTADGWLNDPLGLTWHEGRYHLFFQHVPGSTAWQVGCSWGHATSTDLLHWSLEPVALSPGDGEDGVWSGCIVDGADPVLLYTAVAADDAAMGWVRAAEPLDDHWRAWRKGEVLVRPPADLALVAFRDPFVLADGDGWRMVVGAGLADGRGAALGYRSSDLRTWTADGILAARGQEPSGEVWECPQLVRVDGAWVLLVSVWQGGVLDHIAWAVGDLDVRFTPRRWGRLTWGTCYAGSTFTDVEGRPGLIAWLRDAAGDGWAGALSLPIRLRVVGDEVRVEPSPALAGARGAVLAGPELTVGGAAELEWRAAPGDVLEAGPVRLQAGPGALRLNAPAGQWVLPWAGEVVRVVLDGPVVEVLVAGGVAGLPTGGPVDRVRAEGRLTGWSLV